MLQQRTYMCDFPCRSPSYKGEIRQVLAGISSGQVGSLMDRPWTSSHGTPPQMPEVASRTKSAQQACGEIDYNASLPCPCPKLHGGLDRSFSELWFCSALLQPICFMKSITLSSRHFKLELRFIPVEFWDSHQTIFYFCLPPRLSK